MTTNLQEMSLLELRKLHDGYEIRGEELPDGVELEDVIAELDEREYDFGPGSYDDFDEEGFRLQFADPGGNSALRAATEDNPRNFPCPSCGRKEVLTPEDQRRGYCCDVCAQAHERGLDIEWVGDEPEDEEEVDFGYGHGTDDLSE